MEEINKVVKTALLKSGKTQLALGEMFGMSAASVSNKVRYGRLSWSDLARIAQFTGGQLCICYPDGEAIKIDPPQQDGQEEGQE